MVYVVVGKWYSREMKASAHTHTAYSDGAQSHIEILRVAEKLGMSDVVFSDHDLVIPDEALPELHSYSGSVRWHSGIELTTFYSPRPLAKGGTIHLLGIGVDRTHPKLVAYCSQLQQERIQTMRSTLRHLQSLGFYITEEAVLRRAGKGSVVSPHIVQALELETNPANQQVHATLLAELESEAKKGKRQNAVKLWQDFLDGGPKQEPYVLYMKNYSFKPARGSKRTAMLGMLDSIKLIREAGGKAILAHWFFNKDALPLDQLESLLSDGYFDGLETHVLNTISQNDISADSEVLKALAVTYDIPTLTSSDSHSAEDMILYAESPISAHSSRALRAFLRN